MGKHTEHLPNVAGEPLDSFFIRGRTVPLYEVVPRRVPEERVADRGVRRLIVLGDIQVDRGSPIENLSECVKACRPPGHVRTAAIDVLRQILTKTLELLTQPRLVFGRNVRSRNPFRDRVPSGRTGSGPWLSQARHPCGESV